MIETLIRRCPGMIEAEIDGEIVALHVDNGTCYGFNGTATRIWSLIEEPKKLSELRDLLVGEYDVAPETCESELVQLLKELEADGLVEMQPVDSA